jgi:multicomponent Na+:H+ antiporter subunit G
MIGSFFVGALAIVGGGLVALAGLGILRLPDPLTRASAVSKAAALGLLLVIFAAIVDDWSLRSVIVLVLILIAHLVTVPLAGLALARAAYQSGTAQPPVTTVDEPLAQGRHGKQLPAAQQQVGSDLASPVEDG